jgi:hypothetical protein
MACQGGEAGPPCAPRPLSHEPTRDLSNLKRGDDKARRSTLRRAQGCPSKHRRHGPTPAGSGLPRAHHPEWTCDGVHGDRARLPESPSNLLSFRHIRDTVLAILAVCETGEHTMVKIIFIPLTTTRQSFQARCGMRRAPCGFWTPGTRRRNPDRLRQYLGLPALHLQ